MQRLTDEAGSDFDDPNTVPEAIFAGRADYIPELIAKGRAIDEFDDRGIPASFYSLAMDKTDLLERLFELGADPCVRTSVRQHLPILKCARGCVFARGCFGGRGRGAFGSG